MAIYLIRDNKILECKDTLECRVDDVIVAFCTHNEEEIERWIHNL